MRLTDIDVTGTSVVRIGDRLVPSSFTATFTGEAGDAVAQAVLDIEAGNRVASVRLTAWDGQSVDTDAIRAVRLPPLRREALSAVPTFEAAPEPAKQGGSRSLPFEHYAEVGRVYVDAVAHDQPPTEAVRAHFDTSRPTAGRWVMAARRRGFIPPIDHTGKDD